MIKSDPEAKYRVLHKRAQGETGCVFIAQCMETGEIFALKRMTPQGERERKHIMDEIALLQGFPHSGIVRLYEAYTHYRDVWLVLELLHCSLKDLLLERPRSLPEVLISYISYELVTVLDFIHSAGLIHRDICCDNILLSSQGAVKLGDFGYAAQVTENRRKRTTVIGCPTYMAPEVITGCRYDTKADVWSFGIVVLEMAQGLVGADSAGMALFTTASEPPPRLREPEKWSPELSSFISRCLIKKPNERADTAELKTHPFLANRATAERLAQFIGQE